jgi:dynein heavy chain, axonemal
MFHSVLIERKKYGSIGFSEIYSFNDSDLETSIIMVKNLLEFYQEIPWAALIYMISNIVYGGRVTD